MLMMMMMMKRWNPEEAENARFFFFALDDAYRDSFVSVMIVMVALGHDIKDEDELRDGAYTISAVMLFYHRHFHFWLLRLP